MWGVGRSRRPRSCRRRPRTDPSRTGSHADTRFARSCRCSARGGERCSGPPAGATTHRSGNWPTTTATEIFQDDILDGSNYQPQFLALDGIHVELCEYVIFSYHIVNKAKRPRDRPSRRQSQPRESGDGRRRVRAQIDRQAASAGAATITSIEIASLTIRGLRRRLGRWWIGSAVAPS